MERKKVLISGYYGFNNFGDESILKILVKKLNDMKAEITVASKNPTITEREYRVKSVPTFNFFKMSAALKKCDILISGGGSLLQDATSIKSLVYYLWVIRRALKNKKKVIIFAQGIGPINNPIGRFFVKRTLKKCDWVSVRDDKSLFLLRGWGIKTDLVCDPLFDVELRGSMPSNRVGVQLREFKTLKENLLIKLAEQINKEFADKEINLFSLQDSLDLPVLKRFDAILKSLNPLIKTKIITGTTEEILTEMSKLDYMIAMRFHAALVALKYGIKTLAICYDEKVEKLAQDAHIPSVSMLVTENYDYIFQQLKTIERRKLIEYSNSKKFDWSTFEKVFEK